MASSSDRLSFEQLLEDFRSGAALPDVPLLVAATAQLTPSGGFALGHKTTDRAAVIGDAGPRRILEERATVHLIEKSTRNPFSEMLTIGRATNNDIVIHDSEVSKFHAYFKRSGDGLRLHDAGSTNGTKIDGRAIGKEGAAISTHARITLSPTREFMYVAREDVRSWLEAHAKMMPWRGRSTEPRPAEPAAEKDRSRDTTPAGSEVVGSLAIERLGDVLRRAERESWSGVIDVQIGDSRLELTITTGAIAAFLAQGRPGDRDALARALEADTGLFRFRRTESGSTPPVGSPLGPVSQVLKSIR